MAMAVSKTYRSRKSHWIISVDAMHQKKHIFENNQKILYWEVGRGCHFGSNRLIYIFNFIFLDTALLIFEE